MANRASIEDYFKKFLSSLDFLSKTLESLTSTDELFSHAQSSYLLELGYDEKSIDDLFLRFISSQEGHIRPVLTREEFEDYLEYYIRVVSGDLVVTPADEKNFFKWLAERTTVRRVDVRLGLPESGDVAVQGFYKLRRSLEKELSESGATAADLAKLKELLEALSSQVVLVGHILRKSKVFKKSLEKKLEDALKSTEFYVRKEELEKELETLERERETTKEEIRRDTERIMQLFDDSIRRAEANAIQFNLLTTTLSGRVSEVVEVVKEPRKTEIVKALIEVLERRSLLGKRVSLDAMSKLLEKLEEKSDSYVISIQRGM